VLFDDLLREELRQGTDLVVNLAAGLDARPYRMDVAADLRWVEVDLPAPLDYKESILAGERRRCRLEHVRLDLADRGARRALLARLGSESRRAVVITEGLLIYIDAAGVGELAEDLAAVPSLQRWLVDIVSPGLLAMVRKQMGAQVAAANAPFRFGPAEGPEFFVAHGWRALQVRPLFHEAARYRRLPLWMRPFAWIPAANGRQGRRPWSGVVLLGRA
jgi:methyltransferase (TIGR00027 family)